MVRMRETTSCIIDVSSYYVILTLALFDGG